MRVFPWGKLQRTADGAVQAHSLVDHMTDVAAVMYRLLQLPGIQRAAQQAAGRKLSEIDIARLAVLAFLHDLGKANTGFQGKYWRHANQPPPPEWYSQPCGHGAEGWGLIAATCAGAS